MVLCVNTFIDWIGQLKKWKLPGNPGLTGGKQFYVVFLKLSHYITNQVFV